MGHAALSVGHVGGASEPLYRVTDARIVSGSVYVINGGVELIRYSRAGDFLGRSGGEGEGPGEFRFATAIRRYRGDSLLVYDAALQRASVMSVDLEFGRVVRFDPLPNASFVGVLDDGGAVIRGNDLYFMWPPRRDTSYVVVHHTAGEVRGAVRERALTLPHTVSFSRQMGEDLRVGQMPFGSRAWFAAGGNEVIGATSAIPILHVWNAATGQIREVGFECRRAVVPERMAEDYRRRRVDGVAPARRAELRDFYDEVPFSDSLPLFGQFVRADDGEVWLGAYDDPARPNQPSREWIVVNREHAVDRRIVMPSTFEATQIGDDFIVGVVRDEMLGESVVVYDRRSVDRVGGPLRGGEDPEENRSFEFRR